MTKYVNGVAVGSFNRLNVGDDQINNLANASPAIGVFNGPAMQPRSRFPVSAGTQNGVTANFKAGSTAPRTPKIIPPKPVVPSAVPVPSRTSHSFQGNVGGPGSFRNNAGVSLVPVDRSASGTASHSRMETDSSEEEDSMYDESEMKYAAHWALYRRQMQNWAKELRAKLRLIYSMYPYAAYYYWNSSVEV